MTEPVRIGAAAGLVFLVNIPFGYWRGGLRKLSVPWFAAIHAPVPLVVGIRLLLGLGFRWANLPFFVAAFFAGQFVGMRLRRRVLDRERAEGRPTVSTPSLPGKSAADPE